MADESFLQPDDDTPVSVQNPQEQMPGLAGYVKAKFDDAENGRRSHELRWLQAYKNFKGIYDSTTQYRDSERSKVFIKILLYENQKFLISIQSFTIDLGLVFLLQ